jgi:hypothetical protein
MEPDQNTVPITMPSLIISTLPVQRMQELTPSNT